jgi:hypothetical protein
MIFDRASAGRPESLDFSDVSVSQEPPGARAETYRDQGKLEQNGPAMMNHLSPAACFAYRLHLHKLNGAIEVRVGAVMSKFRCPRHDRACFQVPLI